MIWEFPARKLSVHLHYGAVDVISEEVYRGFGALPRRGAEVGGVLLGRVDRGLEGLTVAVEGFEPIPCRYATGPSYHLSAEELQVLEEKLGERKAGPEAHLRAVGFCRSHTRKEFSMDEADQALCSRFFPELESIFLLIRPFATRICVASLFFWEDGKVVREPSCQEFLFQRRETESGYTTPGWPSDLKTSIAASASPAPVEEEAELPQPVVEKAPSEPAREPESVPEPVPEAQPAPAPELAPPRQFLPTESIPLLNFAPPPTKWSRWWLWSGLAALIVAAAGYWGLSYYHSAARTSPPAPPPVNEELELVASESQFQIELTWNSRAPIVIEAQRAVLTIVDGAFTKNLELDGDQIRNMRRLVYSRVTSDVAFRLEVFGNGRSLSESVRVLRGEPAAATAPAPPAPGTKPPAEAAGAAKSPAAPAKAVRAAEPPAPQRPAPTPIAAKPAAQAPAPAAVKPPVETPAAEVKPPASPEPAPADRELPRPGRRR